MEADLACDLGHEEATRKFSIYKAVYKKGQTTEVTRNSPVLPIHNPISSQKKRIVHASKS